MLKETRDLLEVGSAVRHDDDGAVKLSIAISLKRIADAVSTNAGGNYGELQWAAVELAGWLINKTRS